MLFLLLPIQYSTVQFMFSYNNIIEKGEPPVKDPIEKCLDECVQEDCSKASQFRVPGADCIVVENFLSDEECDAIINACESVGYTYWRQRHHNEDEESSTASEKESKEVRVVNTIEGRFPKLSQRLTERILSAVHLDPKVFHEDMECAEDLYERDLEGEWIPHALSENLLMGRYGPGGHFMPHVDGSTIEDLNTRSMYTLLIYLNDVVDGGETFLLSGDQCKVTVLDEKTNTLRGNPEARIGAVKPKKGSAAFFYHSLLHEASPVGSGFKYICRADLLYRRNPPILTAPKDVEAFALYEKARILESSGKAGEACEMFQRIRRLSRGVAELYQLD